MSPLSGRVLIPASLQRCVETRPQFLPMLKSKKLLNAYAGAFKDVYNLK